MNINYTLTNSSIVSKWHTTAFGLNRNNYYLYWSFIGSGTWVWR